jgi:hypothetical protein
MVGSKPSSSSFIHRYPRVAETNLWPSLLTSNDPDATPPSLSPSSAIECPTVYGVLRIGSVEAEDEFLFFVAGIEVDDESSLFRICAMSAIVPHNLDEDESWRSRICSLAGKIAFRS